jgi:hypothetical protein
MRLIQQTDDMHVLGLNVLFYGDPGIGKTTLAFTAPNPLLLDFDRGVHRASHRKNALQFDSWKDVIDSKAELDKLIAQHDSIVIDTAGAVIEAMQSYIVSVKPELLRNTIKLWGETKRLFQDFFVPLKLSGKNVIFIAHVKEKEENETRIKRPLIPGSSYDLLMQSCDLVGYYTTIGNKRVLTFDLSDTVTAKNCAEIAPLHIGKVYDLNTQLADIIAHTKEALAKRSKEQEETIALVAEWTKKAEAAKDANKFVADLGKAGLGDAVKRAVWAGVVTTFGARGLVWNSETKQFEGKQNV